MKNSILFVMASFVFVVAAEAREYIVKKGDTYAGIARKFYGEPVFGPRGTINTIYRLNPDAKKKATLEPGDKVILADEAENEPKAKAVVARPKAVAPAPKKHAPPGESVLPEEAVLPAHVSQAEQEAQATKKLAELPSPHAEPPLADEAPPLPQDPSPHAALEATKPIEPPTCPVCPPPPPLPQPHETFARAELISPRHESHGENHFSLIPQYSFITQNAKENATGASVGVRSETAYGLELGWDREWNASFSTLLTYSFLQMRSNEKNDSNQAPIFDGTVLNKAELTFFNGFGSRVRAGLGLAYGDHVFLENLAETPSNVSLYRIAFLNPLFAAEIKAVDTESFEAQLALKVAMLPAQTGSGHELKGGTEYAAQLSLIQKFQSWSMLYAVSYASEDQTRTDATETRNEIALKLGAVF